MKQNNRKDKFATCAAVLGFVGLSVFYSSGFVFGDGVPQNFDNEGYKIYDSIDKTPAINMTSGSEGRNLASFYKLRQYPGSPPRIPHEVNVAFTGDENNCLSCHGKGGYAATFDKFAPVTPHPENTLCYQCHAQVETTELFVKNDWKSIAPPRLGLSFLGSSPPAVPHSLQLRENCVACHTGPGAVTEIRVEHAARGDCRQCHVNAVQTKPIQVFKRN